MNANFQKNYYSASIGVWIMMCVCSHLYQETSPENVNISGLIEGINLPSYDYESQPVFTLAADHEDASFPLQINFQNAGTTPPSGYEKDFGEAYGLKTSGLSYGWVSADGTHTPLDLVGNGRKRNKAGYNLLENTFMHMQYNDVGGNSGVNEEGIWEIEIPNGTYQVTVTVGESNNESLTGTHHVINAEGISIIDYIAVLQSPNFAQNSKVITVSDGRLTLDASGGINTKINAVEITSTSSLPSLLFAHDHLSISLSTDGEASENALGNTLTTSDNLISLVYLQASDADGNIPGWLKVAGTELDGTITHNTTASAIIFEYDITSLSVGTYTATVIAIANGYTQASFTTELTVTEAQTEEISFPLQVNFQNAGTTTPTGYEKDFGEAYGLKASGLNYGWVSADDTFTPLDLVGNGRKRNKAGYSLVENTFMHMQYNDVGGNSGVQAEGIWEVAIPNGTYQVSISAGETNNESMTGTHHVINAEGVTVIDYEAILQSSNIEQNARLITVSDGRLTLDAIGGTNTKINAVEITPCGDSPAIIHISIADGATNLDVNTSISVNSFCFPNGTSIDASTLNNNTVFLRNADTGMKVPGEPETTGGGDGLTITPDAPLAPFTQYEFVVTNGLKDGTGVSFRPFSSTFTTGEAGDNLIPITFEPQELVSGTRYTSLAIGPDNKLYGLTENGSIHRWHIEVDGTLSGKQEIDALRNAEGGDRLAIGMCFDPSATNNNPIVWVSHTTYGYKDMADWGGKITKLSGPNLGTVHHYIKNLPRSSKTHVTNGIAFKPGDGEFLYILQGSNTGLGLPDATWGYRPERLLNGAVLKLNIALADEQLAGNYQEGIDVQTAEGAPCESAQTEGTYDPYALDAPLTIYATGVRNAYDLVWHSNGKLFVPTNGSNAGIAPVGEGNCDPMITSEQNDYLYDIEEGGFYGHPNPSRGEWILNGGNPTAAFDGADEVQEYPIPTLPDTNYRGYAYNFGPNISPNGVIEYKSNAFNGALKGKLLVVRYSLNDDILVLKTDGNIMAETSISGTPRFINPIDLVENPSNGNIYLSAYGSLSGEKPPKIILLKSDIDTPEPEGTTIALENMTKIPGTNIGFPADDFYTFHKLKKGSTTAIKWHNTNVMRIRNMGNHPLLINDLQITDNTKFEIVSIDGASFTGDEFPVQIEAGGYKDVTLEFTESVGNKGLRAEKLTIFSNAENNPEWEVDLRGIYMLKAEGSNEVSVQEIIQAFGFTTSLNGVLRPSSDYPLAEDVNNGEHGDFILSNYFEQADLTQPVRGFRLATLQGPGQSDTKLMKTDDNTLVAVFTYRNGGDWHQSLLPGSPNDDNVIAGKSVNTTPLPFRISSAGYKTSGGNNQDKFVDQLLGIRVYKVYDKNGNIIPYHYIVMQDYIKNGCGSNGANCDFNDNVDYFINIKPVDDPFMVSDIGDQTVNAGMPFNYDITGYFDNGYPGNNLTYTANIASSAAPLPNWLSLNWKTGIFSGTPPANTNSSINIAVTATDVNGIGIFDEEASTFTLTITQGNSIVTANHNFNGAETAFLDFQAMDGENKHFVYPNPVGETLRIKFSEPIENGAKIQVIDPMGRMLLEDTFYITDQENSISLDLSALNMPSGLFFLKISSATTAGSILRMVKQ